MVVIMLLLQCVAYADQVGSDIAVSLVGYTSFGTPLITQNQMLSFGWMKSGFGMNSSTITCTFSSAFPVSGHLSLHGGQLTLGTDLIMQNAMEFVSPGIVHGSGHVFDICQSVTGLPATDRSIFKSVNMFIHSDLNITSTVDFKGTCLIDGSKNRIILGNNGSIKVGHNSTLTLRNMEINGVKAFNIYCMDDSASLVLDNVRWIQSGDYTFSSGSFTIQNNVEFASKYQFVYSSGLTSTINSDSTWYFSDLSQVTFGRKRGYTDREPLYFQDYSSVFRLENSTLLITSSGARLTRGTFLCDREVQINAASSSLSGALSLGDGNAANDPYMKLFPGSALKLINGMLAYNVVSASNFLNDEVDVKFIRKGTSTFFALQDISFNNVDIETDLTSQFLINSGVNIDFTNCLITSPYGTYRLSASHYDIYSYLLGLGASTKSVVMSTGLFPNWLHIKNSGNSFSGTGDMGGDIVFHDANAQLLLSLDGRILGDVFLNGGTFSLAKDIRFDDGLIISGTGFVNLSSYICHFGYTDLNWTSSMSWVGSAGTIDLNSNTILSSQWDVYGNSIIDGNGRSLTLMPTASIRVASGGSLTFRNLELRGLTGENVSCVDDSGKVILESVNIIFDNSFSWTRGSLKFLETVELSGANTIYYQSALTSTIGAHSTLSLNNNLTFIIGRKNSVNDREPIYFENAASVLAVDQANLVVTSSGMRFTRGSMEISNLLNVTIESTSSAGGLQLGNNAAADDFSVKFTPGSTLRFVAGHLVYDNVTPNKITANTELSRVVIDPSFNFFINNIFTIKNMTLSFSALWYAFIAPGADLNYENVTLDISGNVFTIDGKRFNDTVFLLPGNGKITIKAGFLPLALIIAGINNVITGSGSTGGPIVLSDASAVMIWDALGYALSPITLGGSSVVLNKPLTFADNIFFEGTGKVAVSNNYVSVGGLSLIGTGTLYWDSLGGSLNLRSNLRLTSAWTFSGNCVIDGVGSSLIFDPHGKIIVERGSTLRFKNIQLKGIAEGMIYCKDDTSKVIFDDTTWAQDSDFTFSNGSFHVVDALTMQGSGATFAYQSSRQSVIDSRSTLYLLDDFTFSYEPLSSSRNLLFLNDRTSKISLQNASLSSSSTGWQLTNGYLDVHGDCFMYSGATYRPEGIIFGNGISEDNDLKVDIFQESVLRLVNGYVVYKNLG